MVKIHIRRAFKDYPDHGIKKGETYYYCDYRKNPMYSKEYINRSDFTDNPVMKKIYIIDDSVLLFDAVDKESFERGRNFILERIAELQNDYKEKLDKSVPGSVPYNIYTRRLQAFNTYYSQIASVNINQPIESAITDLKKIRISLKPKIKK